MMIALLWSGALQTATLALSGSIALRVVQMLADHVSRAPTLEVAHPLSKHHSVE